MELLRNAVKIACDVLTFAIVIRAIMSWFGPRPDNPLVVVLDRITEPIVSPLRRLLPRTGAIDITPMIAIILLQVIVAREKLRLSHPAINLVATLRFRSLLEPSKVFVLESCFIKLDAFSFAGRKEYIGAKFSGKCKNVTTLM